MVDSAVIQKMIADMEAMRAQMTALATDRARQAEQIAQLTADRDRWGHAAQEANWSWRDCGLASSTCRISPPRSVRRAITRSIFEDRSAWAGSRARRMTGMHTRSAYRISLKERGVARVSYWRRWAASAPKKISMTCRRGSNNSDATQEVADLVYAVLAASFEGEDIDLLMARQSGTGITIWLHPSRRYDAPWAGRMTHLFTGFHPP